MPSVGGIRGGVKLRRCAKHKGMYAAQFRRTAKNKINRLKKRVEFDPTARPAIDRLTAKNWGESKP